MNRQEAYQTALRLHEEQSLGDGRIHKIIPYVPLGTINSWLYHGQKPRPEPDLSMLPPNLRDIKNLGWNDCYIAAKILHVQGFGHRRLHKIMPQIKTGTIAAWVNRGSRPRPELNLNPSPALSYILGVIRGDGYAFISREFYSPHDRLYRVGLTAKDKEFVLAFRDAMNKIGVSPKVTMNKKGYYIANIYSKKLVEWSKKLDLSSATRIVEGFPLDFVRGFYDSEGGLDRYSNTSFGLSITNTNLELLQFILKLLSKFGFRINTYKMKISGNRKQCYRLRLLGGTPEVIRFLKLIRPSIPRKNVGGTTA